MIKAIFEDTRQQLGKHDNIKEYCESNKIELIRQQLYIGDYTLVTDQSVCIDTKKGIAELCMDLGADKSRFMREVARAKKHGVKLIVLVEETEKIRTIADVAAWFNPLLNPKSKRFQPHALTGRQIMKRILDVHINYGTEFLFCTRSETGRKVVELLGGDCK